VADGRFNERELVRALPCGDERAFQDLVDCYKEIGTP